MKLTLSLRDGGGGWRKTPRGRWRRRGDDVGGGCWKGGGAEDGIENSNTTAIKLNNDESGRSKYEHGYDLRPRKPRS